MTHLLSKKLLSIKLISGLQVKSFSTSRTNVAPGRDVAAYSSTYRRRVFLVVKGDKGVALASVVGVDNSAIPDELISLCHH